MTDTPPRSAPEGTDSRSTALTGSAPNGMPGAAPLRIGIAGITGRLGMLIADAVRQSIGAELAGGTSRAGNGEGDPRFGGVPLFADLAQLAARCDVVIDVTHAATVPAHAAILAEAKVAWVLGTTGLQAAEQQAVDAASTRIPVVQAANFSAGVTLVLRLARQMAAALPGVEYDAEIVEMHHRQKVDAPSGTALAIGESVASGRGVSLAEVRDSGRDGHTGARKEGAIGFAALRGGQIVGEHTLLFTSASEQISLSHRSFDRRVYAEGALRAAIWLRDQAIGQYSMEDVLGLPPI